MMEGEVFFQVSQDKNRPFEVHTPQGQMRVLGTSFQVRSRAGQVAIDVQSGQVQVATTGISRYIREPLTTVFLLRKNTRPFLQRCDTASVPCIEGSFPRDLQRAREREVRCPQRLNRPGQKIGKVSAF